MSMKQRKFQHTGDYTARPVVGQWYQLPDQSITQCLAVGETMYHFDACSLPRAEFDFIRIERVTPH